MDTWEEAFEEMKDIEKTFKRMDTLPDPLSLTEDIIEQRLDIDEGYIQRVMRLFLLNRKKDSLIYDEHLYGMNTYSLFYRYLLI
mmetsp:Transcript_39276/g.34974  ORF Transcript_39276/g.34974 Transcript_39276/m.34974 type:complete len:84 (-) Transcript_39276:5387-5638(-)